MIDALETKWHKLYRKVLVRITAMAIRESGIAAGLHIERAEFEGFHIEGKLYTPTSAAVLLTNKLTS